ncbi:MAG: TonB-dependent receptor, partial [Candidatus Neomarinimicrobiota bacterium]
MGEVVTVTAEKISIKKDQTSSIKNISSSEIEALPVENINDIVNMQAGVVRGHFRGGRLGEVAYMIDGVPVVDVFSKESQAIEVEKEAVQDLEIITGTFNAEYGRAMSGVVNIVTKDGGDKLEGNIAAFFGNYITSHTDIFIGLKNEDIDRWKDFKLQLSGP